MKRSILLATAAAITFAAPNAFAQSSSGDMQQSDTAMPAPSDVKTVANFVPMAAQSNMLEIETSQMALDRSDSQQVKDFANKMIEDHQKAGEDLKQAVNDVDSSMSVPTSLDAKHQAMVDDLENASDDQFDAAYAELQTKAHQDAVALFNSYSQDGEDGPIKQVASKTLPTLKEHLQMAQNLPTDGSAS